MSNQVRIVDAAEVDRLMHVPHKHLAEVEVCVVKTMGFYPEMDHPCGFLDTEKAQLIVLLDHPLILGAEREVEENFVLLAAAVLALTDHITCCDECLSCEPHRDFIVTNGAARAGVRCSLPRTASTEELERIHAMRKVLKAARREALAETN